MPEPKPTCPACATTGRSVSMTTVRYLSTRDPAWDRAWFCDELVTTTDGVAVFSRGSSPKIHPADGSGPIPIDVPESIVGVVQAPGAPSASDWVVARHRGTPPEDAGVDGAVPAYAVNVRTGAWFDTPPMQLVKNQGFTPFSIREGLIAVSSVDGLVVSRAGWDRALEVTRTQPLFAVIDTSQLFLVVEDEFRVVRVPLELPEEGVDVEFEVLWSRPIGPDELARKGAGVAWSGVVLAPGPSNFGEAGELWAYPLDGTPAFAFVPDSPLLYYGSEYVTGIGIHPEDDTRRYLYRRSLGGDFEVIADRLRSDQSFGEVSHPWTPELGRILYAVDDGDAVSVRQHLLDD